MLPAVVGGTLGVQLAAMALPPLRRLLGLTPLAPIDWALVAGATALPFILKEIRHQGDDHDTANRPLAPARSTPTR